MLTFFLNYNKWKILLFFLFALSSYSNTQINFEFSRNIDFYKPYTPEAQEYILINPNVKSTTNNFSINLPLLKLKSITWFVGLDCKYINHVVYNKVTSYYSAYTYKEFNEVITGYELIDAELDLKSRSFSSGISNEISVLLKEKVKFKHHVGIKNVIFLYEKYKSSYVYSSSGTKFEESDNNGLISSVIPRNFFFSGTNLSLFYRLMWQQSEKFSLATKISLGTNLYSDWDQFKKCAWLGLGLEVGFGNKSLFKKKER